MRLLKDLRYACRSFLRAPLASLTIVITVGLGLGLVAVVFTVLSAFVFRTDDVRNPEELFAVARQPSGNAEPERFTRAQYDALVRDTNVFSDTFATTPDVSAWIDGRRREGRLVTGNFFHLLGVTAARGRTFTSSDDEAGGRRVIVLSHRAWTQQFSSDSAIIGRTILLNGARFEIIGVTPNGFRGLEPAAAPDFWAPLSVVGEFLRTDQQRQSPVRLDIVGRLKPGVSRSQALAQLLAWDAQHVVERSGDRPPSLTLEPRTGTVPLSVDVMLAFMPLFFAFGLILLIGCANVANLLLARAVSRQREIGIRLAIGASRARVVGQLLTESLLLALASAALAFGISRLVLAGVVYVATVTFPPDIGDLRLAVPPADWRVALFLVAGAIVSTIFFALAPALQATRLELVRAIRGEVIRDGRPGRARNVLMTLQVTGSVLLLICAAVFLRSSWAAATVDPGIRTDGIVTVSVLNEQKRNAILDAVKNEPLVASVAGAWPGFLGGLGGVSATAESSGGKVGVTYQYVSPEYFGVFEIDLVRGRGFTAVERSANDAVAIVSESVARQLWPALDPIGQTLRVEPKPERQTDHPLLLSHSVVVVGVAQDVAGIRLGGIRMGGAGVYLPIAPEVTSTTLTMRVRGDAELVRHALADRFALIDPNAGEVSTLQAIARTEVYLLGIPFWLTLVLGGLALALTLSGLFSVLSYLVEQRTKEIGVRMALGATYQNIAALVLSQSAVPVGIGLLLGASLTAALGGVLLATPLAGVIGSAVRLFDPIAYLVSLLFIVTACVCAALIPALRAGRINPVAALRQD